MAGTRYSIWITGIAALVAVAWSAYAERMPFERYQSVVDRQMFGPPPPGFDPTKSPNEVSAKDAREKEQELSKEQEQVKSSVHFSVINVTPSGETAVGFTDNGDSKNPVHYYLKVGETRNGWTVKEADPLAATMTIAKGDVEVSLTLGGNSASNANATKSRSASQSAPRSFGRTLAASRPGGGVGGGIGSLRERRARRDLQRQEAEKAAAEEKAKQAEEREQEKLRRERDEAEREEQRQQLMKMTEELRKMRESSKHEGAGSKEDAKDEDETAGSENESDGE